MRKRMIELGSIGVLVGWALMVVGCGGEEKKDEAAVVRPVKTMLVGSGVGALKRTYPGEIRPYQEVDLAFQVSGLLKELPIKRGDQVEKDQLLAQLDQQDFENERNAAQAVLDEAKATLARYKQAAEKGAISQQQVAEQAAKVEVAQSNLNIKKKAFADTSLTAPFAGRIAERFVENYQNVAAKQKICSLQYIKELDIDFYVPEIDVLTARDEELERWRFFVSLETLPGRVFPATINQYATDADPVTQTYRVKLTMPAPEDVKMRPGMTAQVTWIVEENPQDQNTAVRIPSKAVLSPKSGESKVWIIDPTSMTVSSRDVTLGRLMGDEAASRPAGTEGWVVVKQGLKAGEMIATAGVHYLREGMKVRSMSPSTQEATQ